MSRIANCLRRGGFFTDRDGNVVIVSALLFTVLLTAVGLGIDYAGWTNQRMAMQAVADAAALAGANAYAAERTLAAASAATSRFIGANPIKATNQPSATTELVAGNTAVRVTLQAAGDAHFASALAFAAPQVEVRATAALPTSPTPCVLTLDPNGAKALELNSNASISAMQCAVHTNSTAADALYLDGSASLAAEAVCSRGGYAENANSNISPAPQTGCPEVTDPLAAIAAPAAGACTHTNYVVNSLAIIVGPGVYCGGISVKNNAVVMFAPGIYVIKNGKFKVDSNATVTGVNVGFYLTGTDAVIHFGSNTIVAFTAPAFGTMAGILFFEDRSSPLLREHRIDSNNIGLLEGAIYLPRGRLLSYSNSQVGANSNFTMLIARQIRFDSNADWVINADYGNSGVPVPGASAATAVRLIE